MKKYLKLMKTVSEKREALNKYLSETPTEKRDESRVTELRGDLDKAESAFRVAVDAYSEDDDTETRTLQDRIELRNYMTSAMTGERVTGAEAEFNKEVGLSDLNTVPWEALEERQDVATTVADEAIGNQRQTLPLPRRSPILPPLPPRSPRST